MKKNHLVKKLQIKDLSIETQSLLDSDNIVGADNHSASTFYCYDFNQPGNKLKFPIFVTYRAGGTYNPWRKR